MNRTEWAPSGLAIAGVALAGVVMALGFLTMATDAPGRILTGTAAFGLLLFAAGSWRARPRLAITADGLVYRGWVRTRTLRRSDIDLIRITEFRRWGRTVRLLEIDTKDAETRGADATDAGPQETGTGAGQLLVLNRWDLGGDPLTVLDALTDAGYAGR